MTLAVDDLYCATCRGYVHPFLERCPACGAAHASWYDDVQRDPDARGVAFAEDPLMRDAADELHRKYMLLSGRRGSLSFGNQEAVPGPTVDVGELLGRVAGSLPYRAFAATTGAAAGIDAALAVTSEGLQLREAPRGPVLVTVHPSLVLSAACSSSHRRAADGWAGVVFAGVEALPEPVVPGGDLLVTYAAGGSFAQFSVTNRRGLFTTKARPDHYRTLARWLGLLAGTAARDRWLEIGPGAYARELGLLPAGGADHAGNASGMAPAPAASVREALEELTALRSAKLVTDAEYELKRREILDRL